jgi:hypothetical protein
MRTFGTRYVGGFVPGDALVPRALRGYLQIRAFGTENTCISSVNSRIFSSYVSVLTPVQAMLAFPTKNILTRQCSIGVSGKLCVIFSETENSRKNLEDLLLLLSLRE